jgi:glyceraldehyde 3-phosphate dehydrogenase
MAIRIGLMGFGRLGRNIFRILSSRDDVEIAAISDVAEHKALEYLLRFDTVFGRFPGEVSIEGGRLRLGEKSIPVLSGKDPGDVCWSDVGAEIVVEATARPRTREVIERHIEQGAKKVILCVPPLDEPDITIVMGVNERDLRPEHRIISNASCTAHCLGPIAKVLHESFGIRQGFVTTVHAYTNAQRLADVPAGDMRMSRAAAENIIPSDTRSHELVMHLLPALKGKLGGMAMNVPVPDGSVIDLVVTLDRKTTRDGINAAIRDAANTRLTGIVQYETYPIVSSDVTGNPHSAIFDSMATLMLGDDMVKVLAWFDNSWGYSNRVLDVVKRLTAQAGMAAQGVSQ